MILELSEELVPFRRLFDRVVLLFSVGNPDNARLALAQARRVGVDSAVIVTDSVAHCTRFDGAHCVYTPFDNAPTPRHQILRLRIRALNRFFKSGLDAFQLDTDVIWYQNPFEILVTFKDVGFVAASDGKLANAGVVFVQHVSNSSDVVISNLLSEWESSMYNGGGDEQGLLHDLLASRILNTTTLSIEGMTNRTAKAIVRERRDRRLWHLNSCGFDKRCFTLIDHTDSARMVALSHAFSYGQNLQRRLCDRTPPVLVHLSGYPSKMLRPLILDAAHKYMKQRLSPQMAVTMQRARAYYLSQLNHSRIELPLIVHGKQTAMPPSWDVYPLGCHDHRTISLYVPYSSHGFNRSMVQKMTVCEAQDLDARHG